MAEAGSLMLGSQVGYLGRPSRDAPQGFTLACSDLCAITE